MIEKYAFDRQIQGNWYGCEIYAESFADAERIAKAAKGKNLGLVAEQPESICEDCLQPLQCLECLDMKDGMYLPPDIPMFQD